MGNSFKKYIRKGTVILTTAAVLSTMCACSLPYAGNDNTDIIMNNGSKYSLLSKEDAIECLLSNDDYFNGLTQEDINYRMQKQYDMSAGLDEFKQYAADQINEFTSEEHVFISESLERLEDAINSNGYVLPMPKELNFIKTTANEEGGVAGYTHKNQIYLNEDFIKICVENKDDTDFLKFFDEIMYHELFHCIIRNNKEFKKNIYSAVGVAVLDEAVQIPKEVADKIFTYPDVEAFDSYVTLTVGAEKKDCVVIPYIIQPFENEGDTFYDAIEARLYVINPDGGLHAIDESPDFWDVFGKNTNYTVSIEETLADNFAYAMVYDDEEIAEIGFDTPELLTRIKNILAGETVPAIGESVNFSESKDYYPWIDSDIKENITDNMMISAQDDFYLYANHDWIMSNDIPAGQASMQLFNDVEKITRNNIKTVLRDTKIAGHDAELVRDIYRKCLDWSSRNRLGMEPVKPVINAVQNISTLSELSDFICDADNILEAPVLLACNNSKNINDSSSYITVLGFEGFLLDDAAEYKNRTQYGDRIYEADKNAASALLTRVGYSQDEAEELFDRAISFEAKVAEASMTTDNVMELVYFEKINNVMTLDGVAGLFNSFPVIRYIKAAGYDNAEQFLVPEPDALRRFDEVYSADNLEDMKACIIVNYILNSAQNLDKKSYNIAMECSDAINGTTERISDEDYAYEFIKENMSEPFVKAYLQKYDASDKKQKVTELCNDILDAYKEMLNDEKWISQEMRAAAINKLDNMTINAVYPDKWIDYSSLSFEGLSYFDSIRAMEKFYADYDRSNTNGNVDKYIWNANTLDVNVYYDELDNSINVMLGILDGEFYNDNMSNEELYGAIGAIIAHEVSHAFDMNGARFDENGNACRWWTNKDYDAFRDRASKVVKYYNNIVTNDGGHIRSRSVQAEVISDMAGVKCMLMMAKKDSGFDYDKFFRQYANTWKVINTPEKEAELIARDTHPLPYLRTNVTLQQFDEFLETYDIKPGDNMYLAPEDRILVW